MKKFLVLLISSFFIIFLFNSCKEEVITTDIFEPEVADPDNLTSVNLEGMGEIFVSNDRIQIEDGIANIKGTIYSEIEGEFVAVTNGDFTLSELTDGDVYGELEGYGRAHIPEIGEFESIVTDFTSGANFGFMSGQEIKENDEMAPVLEDLNYFGITLNEDIGEKFQFSIKNTTFKPKAFYMDPNDPMIYFRGDIGTPKYSIEDAGLGLSARGNLAFTPYTYSEEMEEIMKVPFPSITGNIFISGLIPIPKFNVSVYGEALVGFTLNENGFEEFFENGFEGAEYRMGINGTVIVDEGVIEWLPETELARATVVVELEEEGDQYIQMAGESQMQPDYLVDILGKLDGGALTSSFTMPAQTVEAYLYIGNNLDNSQFFLRTSLTMDVPGIGEQELVEALFGIDNEHIFIGGHMGIPGLAQVYISGDVYYTGKFTLTGGAELEVDVDVATLSVGFEVTVTEQGFSISATASGEISGQGVSVSATVVLDWVTGDLQVCMDLPVVGNTCSSFRNGVQRTLNGRQYHPEIEPISVPDKL